MTKNKNKNKILKSKKVIRKITFLDDQMFRGVFYRKGDSITLDQKTANSYVSRKNIQIF